MFRDVEDKIKKKNKILISRESKSLEQLVNLMDKLSHRTLVFNGRILNMKEALEKKLLRNIRAHRVNGGIWTDIMGCKSDMFSCLDCKHFAPDYENLDYFKGQVISWEKRTKQFENLPMVSQNARKNAKLFQGVVDKIIAVKCGDTVE